MDREHELMTDIEIYRKMTFHKKYGIIFSYLNRMVFKREIL